MSDLATERERRGLPPYRRETPRWRYWTTQEIALAALATKGAVQQRVRRGQFPGAMKIVDEAGMRWLVPESAARSFIVRHRKKVLADTTRLYNRNLA